MRCRKLAKYTPIICLHILHVAVTCTPLNGTAAVAMLVFALSLYLLAIGFLYTSIAKLKLLSGKEARKQK